MAVKGKSLMSKTQRRAIDTRLGFMLQTLGFSIICFYYKSLPIISIKYSNLWSV